MRKYTIIFVIFFTCGIGDIFHGVAEEMKSNNVMESKDGIRINWSDFKYTGIN